MPPPDPSEARRKLVFIAEDDEEQLVVLRMVLSGAGFDVVTESFADKVVQGVRDVMPDIVLLDVMMPSKEGRDGFQICQEIKEDARLRNTPVIIVSAIAAGVGEQREKIRKQVGAQDFFQKPYDPNVLVSRVKELTGSSR